MPGVLVEGFFVPLAVRSVLLRAKSSARRAYGPVGVAFSVSTIRGDALTLGSSHTGGPLPGRMIHE